MCLLFQTFICDRRDEFGCQVCVLKQGRLSILYCAVSSSSEICGTSVVFWGFYSSGVVVFLGNQRESKFDWNLVAFCVSLKRSQGKETRVGFAFGDGFCMRQKKGIFTAFAWVAFSGAVLDAWCAVICFHDFSCAVIMLRNLSFYA